MLSRKRKNSPVEPKKIKIRGKKAAPKKEDINAAGYEELSHIWKCIIIQLKSIVLRSCTCFTFDTVRHASFDSVFRLTWNEMGLETYDEHPSGTIVPIVKSVAKYKKKVVPNTPLNNPKNRQNPFGAKLTKTGLRNVRLYQSDMIEVTRICPSHATATRFVLDQDTIESILLKIFKNKDWIKSITEESHIPPSIHQAFHSTRMHINDVFINIKTNPSITDLSHSYGNINNNKNNDLPDFLYDMVCVNRYMYHRQCVDAALEQYGLPVKYKHDYTDYNEIDRDSNDSDDEDNDNDRDANNELEEEDDNDTRSYKRLKILHTGTRIYEDDDNSSGSESGDDLTPIVYYNKSNVMHPSLERNSESVSSEISNENDINQQNDDTDENNNDDDSHQPTELLMGRDDVVRIRRLVLRRTDEKPHGDITWSKSPPKYHPYTLSAVIFALSIHISQRLRDESKIQGWSPRKIYLFLKDWLADQIPTFASNPPVLLHKIATSILFFLSDAPERPEDKLIWEYMKKLFVFFTDVHMLLRKHRRSEADSMMDSPRRGDLQPFRVLDEHEYKKLIDSDFYVHHSPNPDRESAVMHCQCGNEECKPRVLVFQRNRVSPLQLHTSLEILERHFIVKTHRQIPHHTNFQLWSIAFTEDLTILLVEKNFIDDVIMRYTPAFLTRKYVIRRTVPFPLYYIHLHNYFYGDSFSILVSMKFVLSCFCASRHQYLDKNNVNLMPQNIKDPLIDYYRILHIIMDRFSSESVIWQALKAPLKDETQLWFETKQSKNNKTGETMQRQRLIGFRDDWPSIYSALRAFILVYGQHLLARPVFTDLIQFFVTNPHIKENHRLAWGLLERMEEMDGTREMSDFIEIPFIDVFDYDIFPFPSHVLLYYLCCSSDIPNELAGRLFLSLSVHTRPKGRNSGVQRNSKIRFPSHVPKLHSLEKYKHQMVYQSVLFREQFAKYNNNSPYRSYSNCNQSKNSTALTATSSGIETMFRALEELSYHPTRHIRSANDLKTSETYRGNVEKLEYYVPLTAKEVLSDKNMAPALPIDIQLPSGDPILWNRAFPIWQSTMMDESTHRPFRSKNAFVDDEQLKRTAKQSIVGVNELDAIPFCGCHPDTLECILLQPIVVVDAIPEWDLEVMRNPNQSAYLELEKIHLHGNLPIDTRYWLEPDIIDKMRNRSNDPTINNNKRQNIDTSIPSPSESGTKNTRIDDRLGHYTKLFFHVENDRKHHNRIGLFHLMNQVISSVTPNESIDHANVKGRQRKTRQ